MNLSPLWPKIMLLTGADNPLLAMDALQDEGLISDCCVDPEDVPESDLRKAVVKLTFESRTEP